MTSSICRQVLGHCLLCGSDQCSGALPELVSPSSITGALAFYHPPLCVYEELRNEIHGSWLVFRYFGRDIDDTWRVLTKAYDCGQLAGGMTSSTLMYDPTCAGPGYSNSGVICVYTTEKLMDKVGFQLVNIVQHDIKYKTVEATMSGMYNHRGAKRVTLKTLFWNEGNPSFECQVTKPRPLYDPSYCPPVVRRHTAVAPKPHCYDNAYGKWIISCTHDDLTDDFHTIREELESGRLGAIRMVCPKKKSPLDDPILIVFTNESKMRKVGCKLANIMETDVTFQRHYRSSSTSSSSSPTSPGIREDSAMVSSTALDSVCTKGEPLSGVLRVCWNNGDPYFEKRWKATNSQEVDEESP